MAEEDVSADLKTKEEVDEVAREPKKKSRSIDDLVRAEKRKGSNQKMAIGISIIIFFVLIIVELIVPNSLSLFFAIIIFFIIIGATTNQFNQRRGKFDFINSFTLSERYKYYLYKLSKLLNNYCDTTDENFKRDYAKKMIFCMENLYNLTVSWDFPPENKYTTYYIDLFTNDLDEFNFKLRILILRLNGFVDQLKDIPDSFRRNFKLLTDHLNYKSLEIDEKHHELLNVSINILEHPPDIYKLEFYEPVISIIIKKFLKKTWRFFLGLYIWFMAICIYMVFITSVDLGIDSNAKFQGLIAVMIGTAIFLLQLVRKR